MPDNNVPRANIAFFAISEGPVREALRPLHPFFATTFLFGAVMAVLTLTTSFYMLEVYDRVLASRSIETLVLLTIMAAIALATLGWLDSLRQRLLSRLSMRLADDLGPAVLRAMISTAAQLGLPNARNGLRDLDTIRSFIASPPFSALMDAPFALFFVVVLFLLHPVFVAVVLAGGTVLTLLALANQRATSASMTRSIAGSVRAINFAEDGLRNADVLEGMGMSGTFVARWHDKWIDAMRASSKASEREYSYTATSKAFRYFVQVAMLGTGALLILGFSASGGVMIAASIIGARALLPIEMIVSSWKTLVAVRGALYRLNELLLQSPKREEGMPLPAPEGRISARGVSYNAAGRAIIRNVNFDLSAGETLAVVGPSGSGKSSLLRLLVGAWPCSTGAVRLDSCNVFSWPRADIARHVGYLPQDVELFAGTVRENISRMGSDNPEEIARAAIRAGAHDMILSLPNGYDTEIGSHDQKLSGGQAQRIGIARAFYLSPRLVVLDEPNSNLDAAGEESLLAALATLRRQGTTIVIVAHRASILRNVDKILALSNGSVEAFGPRDAVLQHFAGHTPAATDERIRAGA